MKKKTIAVVCAVLAVVVAGGGLLWYFLRDNAAPEDESVVYVNTVAQLTGISQGNGLQNRFAGVVESKNTWKVEKNAEKTVKEVYVEVGQEVQQGTPLFSYDTDQFQANLEQARLDLERGQNEISSMRDSISQLEKEKKSAPKDQQASLTLDIQQAELDLKNKEYEILLFLMSNADIVFSKETLYERIWGYDALGDNATVAVHINRLREKIEKNPAQPRYIQTVWGVGYRFKP